MEVCDGGWSWWERLGPVCYVVRWGLAGEGSIGNRAGDQSVSGSNLSRLSLTQHLFHQIKVHEISHDKYCSESIR